MDCLSLVHPGLLHPELQWARLEGEAVKVSLLSFREAVSGEQVGDPGLILAVVV